MYIQNNLLYMIGIKIGFVLFLFCENQNFEKKLSCLRHLSCSGCGLNSEAWGAAAAGWRSYSPPIIPGIATGRHTQHFVVSHTLSLTHTSTPRSCSRRERGKMRVRKGGECVSVCVWERECVRESVCVREKGRESERDNHYNHFISIIVLYNLFIPISKPVFLTHWYKQLCYSMYGCGDMHHFI